MAEETPENLQEEVETAAGEGAGEPVTTDAETLEAEAPTADAVESAAATPAAPSGGAKRRERLDARRAVRTAEAGRRPARTPEERAAERQQARREKAATRRRYRARVKAKAAERRAAQPAQEPDHAEEHGPGRAKVRQGVVVSDKADKTIVVRMDMVRRHRRYHKILRSTVTLHAHDERNDANTGDTVRVQECRPMSRTKRWRLVDVVERAR
jgi:small subunit ribosomal protein S17